MSIRRCTFSAPIAAMSGFSVSSDSIRLASPFDAAFGPEAA